MSNIVAKTPVTDIILTPTEAAKILKVSLPTLYRMINRGEIKTLPISGHVRIYGDQFFSEKEKAQEEMIKRIWRDEPCLN